MAASKKKIVVFLLLTAALSAVFYVPIIASGTLQPYAVGLMWSPGIAALLTQLIVTRSLRGLGWPPGRPRYLALAYALPAVYGLAMYGVAWLTGLGTFAPEAMAGQVAAQLGLDTPPAVLLPLYTLAMATVGVVINCLPALGEEIGWRGLLVPELAKQTSFGKASLISGGIWALWHVPGILFADYSNLGAPVWFSVTCFVIGVIGISFAFAWLRLRSGSVWPAVVLHAAHNLFIQGIFTPLTEPTGLTPYVLDEFGIGLAVVGIVVALLFWRRRGEVMAHTEGEGGSF